MRGNVCPGICELLLGCLCRMTTVSTMNPGSLPPPSLQGIATEKILYYFVNLRKDEVRGRVAELRVRYPGESPEQLARRLVNAQTLVDSLGGALLHLPAFVQKAWLPLWTFGVATSTHAMMRMHLDLILEIALLFGRDIDDRARVREIAVIVAATSLMFVTPLLIRALTLNPWYAIPAGALMVMAINQLIGEAAVRYFRRVPKEGAPQSGPSRAPAFSGAA